MNEERERYDMNGENQIVWEFDGWPVRTHVDENGMTWWSGKDVAAALGYSPKSKPTKHCKGELKRHTLDTAGGKQELVLISAPDVLRLVTHSKLPSAVSFEKWVYEVVLPSI